MRRIAKKISTIVLLALISACSTSGGIYKKGDSVNGEFSPGRTVLGVVGALASVAAAAAVKKGGGGGGYGAQNFEWDFQPGNGQWACRNTANGEYAFEHNCAGKMKVDYWP